MWGHMAGIGNLADWSDTGGAVPCELMDSLDEMGAPAALDAGMGRAPSITSDGGGAGDLDYLYQMGGTRWGDWGASIEESVIPVFPPASLPPRPSVTSPSTASTSTLEGDTCEPHQVLPGAKTATTQGAAADVHNDESSAENAAHSNGGAEERRESHAGKSVPMGAAAVSSDAAETAETASADSLTVTGPRRTRGLRGAAAAAARGGVALPASSGAAEEEARGGGRGGAASSSPSGRSSARAKSGAGHASKAGGAQVSPPSSSRGAKRTSQEANKAKAPASGSKGGGSAGAGKRQKLEGGGADGANGAGSGKVKGERGLTEAELASTLIGLSHSGNYGGADRSASAASSSNGASAADGPVPTSQEALLLHKKHRRLIKNRESAQLSRMRKKNHLESLEAQVQELEQERAALQARMKQLRDENERLRMGGGAANVLDLLAEAPKDGGDRMESPPLSETSPLTLEDSTWAITPTKSVQPASASSHHDVSNTKSVQPAVASGNQDVTNDNASASASSHLAANAPGAASSVAERGAVRKENPRKAGLSSASGVTGVTGTSKQGVSAGAIGGMGNVGGGGATKGKLLPARATRGLAPTR